MQTSNNASNPLPVATGVPQGSVLGPLRFLIYINDLPLSVSSHIRVFADDCVVYSTITNISDQILLQNDLNNIQNWCDDWLILLNPSKCKVMSMTRCRNTLRFSYVIYNKPIEPVKSFKYLGITISDGLD